MLQLESSEKLVSFQTADKDQGQGWAQSEKTVWQAKRSFRQKDKGVSS